MIYTKTTIQDFLAELFPFNQLPTASLAKLCGKLQFLRYRIGQAILLREQMPAQISILYEGQARLLIYDSHAQAPVTLQLLKKGEILGWVSLLRGIPCETVIASTEAVCLTLEATEFLDLLKHNPAFAKGFENQCSVSEIFELLSTELTRRADSKAVLLSCDSADIKELTLKVFKEAVVCTLLKGKYPFQKLDSNLVWFVSGGKLRDFLVGSQLQPKDGATQLEVSSAVRLVGFPKTILYPKTSTDTEESTEINLLPLDIAYGPDHPPKLDHDHSHKYPYIHARGSVEGILACFQMLSQYWNIPFRRDVIRKVVNNQIQRTQSVSLQLCGAVAELMGLNALLINVPASAVTKLQAPAIIRWQDSFAILYEISEQKLILGVPEVGIVEQKPAKFIENWGDEGQVLLLKSTKCTPKQRFSLRWFIPSFFKYRKVLFEVLIASFFVQIFALANPLIVRIQVWGS